MTFTTSPQFNCTVSFSKTSAVPDGPVFLFLVLSLLILFPGQVLIIFFRSDWHGPKFLFCFEFQWKYCRREEDTHDGLEPNNSIDGFSEKAKINEQDSGRTFGEVERSTNEGERTGVVDERWMKANVDDEKEKSLSQERKFPNDGLLTFRFIPRNFWNKDL